MPESDYRPDPQDGFGDTPSPEDWNEYCEWLDAAAWLENIETDR